MLLLVTGCLSVEVEMPNQYVTTDCATVSSNPYEFEDPEQVRALV